MSTEPAPSMNEQPRAFHAFISYASPDKDKAHSICESLEAKGLTCWIAPRDLRPGQEYGEEIVSGIRDSKCLVLVLSESANASPMVRREVERAVSTSKPVFPIRIEEVLPARSLEFFISATHWIDAWEGVLVDHAARLADELLDDRLVEEARDTLVGKKRRRKMVRQASLSSVVLLVVTAIALTFAFTRGSGGGAGGGPFGEGYDPVKTAAESQGFDIDDLKASDFDVSFEELYGMLVVAVETTPIVEALASEGMLQGRLGDRPWSMVSSGASLDGGLALYLKERDIEADGPVQLRIFANDGRTGSPTYGPFEFDIYASDARASIASGQFDNAKERIESETWLVAQRYGGWRFDVRLMADVRELIRSIEIGTREGQASTDWVLPRAPSPTGFGESIMDFDPIDQVAMASQDIQVLTPFMKEPVLYTRVTFLDGTQSSWRRFDRITSVLSSMSANAAGEIQDYNDGYNLLSFSDLLNVDLGGAAAPFTISVAGPGAQRWIELDMMPEGARSERIDHWYVEPRRVWGPTIPPDWESVTAHVRDLEGNTLARRTFSVSPRDQWLPMPSSDPDAPTLYADLGDDEHHSLRFMVYSPKGTVSLLCGVGGIPTHAAYHSNRTFSWPCGTEPVLTYDFRIIFQLEDGGEVGPFSYDLRSLEEATRSYWLPLAQRNRTRLLKAVRRGDDIGQQGFFRIQRALGGLGLEKGLYSDWINGPSRGVVLVPSNSTDGVHGWAAVSKVRAGVSPDTLTLEADVSIDTERVVRSRNNIGGLPGDSSMGLLALPLDTERVFVQFELFDGTVLDPVEIPVIDAEDF